MGAFAAWTLIALAAPSFLGGPAHPPIVVLLACAAIAALVSEKLPPLDAARLEPFVWGVTLFVSFYSAGQAVFAAVALGTPPAVTPWLVVAQVCIVLVALAMAPPLRPRLPPIATRALLPFATAAATIAAATVVISVPNPYIDVFYFLNEGVRGLVQGLDPYAMTYTALPTSMPGYSDLRYLNEYSYLPGMMFLSLLSLPFGDVRWVMVASLPISVLCFRRILARIQAPARLADLLAVDFIAYPGLLLVMRQAWPELLVACCFLLALLALMSGRVAWAIVPAALVLSIKAFDPPLLLPLWAACLRLRATAMTVLLAAAVTLPFVVWSPADFWRDIVVYQATVAARPDAVSFNGLLLSVAGIGLPLWLQIGPPLLVGSFAVWRTLSGASLGEVLRLTACAYLVLLLFAKIAYANEYFLVQALLLVAAGTSLGAWSISSTVVSQTPTATSPERPTSRSAVQPLSIADGGAEEPV